MNFTTFLVPVRVLACGTLLVAFSQCSVSDKVRESPGSVRAEVSTRTLKKENTAIEAIAYRLDYIDEARLAGQDIMFVREAADLTPQQQAKLQTALQAGNLPLRLRMRIYARNPGKENIQLQKLDYQLLLDGRELTTGSTGVGMALEPSTIVTLPIDINLNVASNLTNGATPLTFASGLTNFTKNAQRLELRIRPAYASVSGNTVQADSFTPIDLISAKKPKR